MRGGDTEPKAWRACTPLFRWSAIYWLEDARANGICLCRVVKTEALTTPRATANTPCRP
jgi:hypothetical protein